MNLSIMYSNFYIYVIGLFQQKCLPPGLHNYRPIALASILSKVFERIIWLKLEMYILTAENQFGFKRKHGTDLCIYALKEIVSGTQVLIYLYFYALLMLTKLSIEFVMKNCLWS